MVGWQIKSKSVTTDYKEKFECCGITNNAFISKDCTEVLTQHCVDIYNLTIPASDPQYFQQ